MESSNYLRQLLLILMLTLTQAEAQTLRSLADAKGKYIGNLMRDGFFNDHQINNGATDLIAKTEYNTLVVGNKMKMSNLLKNRPVDPFNVQVSDINTADIDRFVAYANANGMRKRGHVMIWYKQIPQWLSTEAPTWTAQQIYDFSRTYIIALSTYTTGKIDEWDVLNEAILDGSSGYRSGTWYDIVNTQANSAGKMGYMEYFSSLFKWARQGDPNVPLFYNDYNIEPLGTTKNNFMRTMVKELKNTYNTPITGVGLQSHFSLSAINSTFIDKIGQTIDDLGVSGFTVNLTELDIKICDGDVVTLEDQRIAYRDIVSAALSRSNCNTVLIWGMSDNDSWIPGHSPGCGQATPHDELLQKKPAYFGIQEALISLDVNEGINTVNGPVSVSLGEIITISVAYEASEARDIVVMFQRDNTPYTTYETLRNNVAAGVGNLNVLLTIPQSVPIASNDYQYQVFIAPIGGVWSDRIDNLNQANVSVSPTLSVNDVSINTVCVYPNPAATILTLSEVTSEDQIAIYDLYGKKQSIIKIPSLQTENKVLNVSQLASGLYLLKINRNNTSKTIKFIKE